MDKFQKMYIAALDGLCLVAILLYDSHGRTLEGQQGTSEASVFTVYALNR